ncbi:MAG: 4Fe-4S dicluster domain-containing protein [Clostridiales bacterium]|nr:4Fe-4S dicluster domain-containing protein [Clostridiales bacterium]
MVKLSVSKLNDFFNLIASKEKLYIPVDTAEGAAFKPYEEGMKYSSACNTTRSAKDFFFPQVENLVNFKIKDKSIEVIDNRTDTEKFVIFGVRACDVASFDILDKVYLQDPVDSFYKNRRDNGTIITLACDRPQETCFCQSFGIDAANPAGDVSAWIVGDDICFNANNEKGEAVLEIAASLLSCSDESEVEVKKAEIKSILEKLPIKDISLDKISSKDLMENFNSPVWDEIFSPCLGCGTCTFVCPTCQCFDVREFKTNDGIIRFRCWDSCMYSDFTRMAHGNNRNSQKERFRQRFMHKLVYFPNNNDGVYGCVGCGRCLKSCPQSLNIVKVAKALGGKE